ncbi:MAG: TerB family tellurite resistance protein [Bacteroidetes bacterium]|nr:TerB family tellurite resistance protein [Bacteroidota bacterium]
MRIFLYILIAVLVFYLVSGLIKRSNRGKGQPESPPRSRRKSSYAKWVGGGLGWAFGGPIGGILGFVFGSIYDGMQSGSYEYKGTQTGDFSASLLILTAAVMKADGKVVKSELDYVRNFLIAQFGQEEAQKQILILREILKQDIQVKDVCAQIAQYMEYPSRLQLLHILFGISSADRHYHDAEVNMIEQIGIYLGIRPEDFRSIRAMFIKDIDSAYKILEVSPDTTDEEVKKAYHRMAVKYHPDKVAHLGEDIRKAATEKFQKLNAAYEEIKKRRGMK